MNNDLKEYTIFDAVTPQTVTSSTDASPSVVTKVAHGLATGDRILIIGHGTNLAINGIFDVVKVDADTFTLKDINTKAAINGTGSSGAGSGGIMMTAPKVPFIADFRNAVLQIGTSGTATTTMKVAGSIGKVDGSAPNFGGTVIPTNPWSFVESVDLSDGSSVAGATGVVVAGTDIQKILEVNVNTLKFLTLIPVTWTQGAITAKLILTNNK